MILEKEIQENIENALKKLKWPKVDVLFSLPKQKDHGDVATNIAFKLSKKVGKPPREVAQVIIDSISSLPKEVKKAEVAGAGFINFYIDRLAYFKALDKIQKEKEKFGQTNAKKNKKVIIEFVSANPTGPLNVVSARAAAIGDVLANLLAATGYQVHREFYVNDIGNQIELFGKSIQARLLNEEPPEGGYQGEYVSDLAKNLDSKKTYSLEELKNLGLDSMISGQKEALANFGVKFDRWYLQSELIRKKKVEKAIEKLKKSKYVYEKEGAQFFKSSDFGDDKDRVVQKQDGEYSYFASDIAYHDEKFGRGFGWVIDILGPDHHGYIARTKAAVEACGWDPKHFTILIVQQVNFIENEMLVKMSKRAGKLITMQTLVNEVGKDAARFFFLQRATSTHLDFDLELAKKKSLENPVYYVQYAHARIASIFRKAEEAGVVYSSKEVDLSLLELPEEKELAKVILGLPDHLARAAQDLEPHQIIFYILNLAKQFQSYYSQAKNDDRYRVINTANLKSTLAKLYLLKNIQIVIQNTLNLLGISAPDKMEREEV